MPNPANVLVPSSPGLCGSSCQTATWEVSVLCLIKSQQWKRAVCIQTLILNHTEIKHFKCTNWTENKLKFVGKNVRESLSVTCQMNSKIMGDPGVKCSENDLCWNICTVFYSKRRVKKWARHLTWDANYLWIKLQIFIRKLYFQNMAENVSE